MTNPLTQKRIAVLAGSHKQYLKFVHQDVPKDDRHLYVHVATVEQVDAYKHWYYFMEVGTSFSIPDYVDVKRALIKATTPVA